MFGFAIPPWVRIAGPIILAILIFGAGWQVASWRASGKIEKLQGEVTASELSAATAGAERDTCLGDIVAVNKKLDTMAESRDLLEIQYQEMVSRPPETVTRWRTKWKEVPSVVTSADCDEGLRQLVGFIKDLPERGTYAPPPE